MYLRATRVSGNNSRRPNARPLDPWHEVWDPHHPMEVQHGQDPSAPRPWAHGPTGAQTAMPKGTVLLVNTLTQDLALSPSWQAPSKAAQVAP